MTTFDLVETERHSIVGGFAVELADLVHESGPAGDPPTTTGPGDPAASVPAGTAARIGRTADAATRESREGLGRR